MSQRPSNQAKATVIKALCLCTMAVILIAGLWPFSAPKNKVEWIGREDGLQFGHHGTIVTSGAFQTRAARRDDLGSIELWLEPAPVESRHTILAFEGAGQSQNPFRLQQSGHALIVQRHNIDEHGTDRTAEIIVNRALNEGERTFVTVTLGEHETSVYLNGVLAKIAPSLGTSTGNFTGRMVLGNSCSASDSWPGKVLGLAIFHSQLTTPVIAEHFENWKKNHGLALLAADEPAALYRFNERAGQLIGNQVDHATDLTIPANYFVLHPEFLTWPWVHYHSSWSYWGDVAINVAGFVPFGFSIAGYFSSVRPMRNSATLTVALGFLTSLTIEVSQAFLPTRDSGVNDLITNTLGTAIGVMLYRSQWLEPLVQRTASMIAPLMPKVVKPVEVGSQV